MDSRAYREMYECEDKHWWFKSRRELVVELLHRVGVHGPVLDIGCGTGCTLQLLQSEFSQAYGLDNASIALRYCAARNLTNLFQGSAEATGFRDDSFGAVTLLDVLEHVEHDYLALAEARRVLRPGGVLVVTVPAHPWLWSSHDRFLHHYRRYRGEDLRARLEEAGFSTEQMSHLYMTLFPVVACVRLWEHSAERERSYMGPATGVLPDLLSWICNMEARLVRRGGCLPFGSSLLAVCRGPA